MNAVLQSEHEWHSIFAARLCDRLPVLDDHGVHDRVVVAQLAQHLSHVHEVLLIENVVRADEVAGIGSLTAIVAQDRNAFLVIILDRLQAVHRRLLNDTSSAKFVWKR